MPRICTRSGSLPRSRRPGLSDRGWSFPMRVASVACAFSARSMNSTNIGAPSGPMPSRSPGSNSVTHCAVRAAPLRPHCWIRPCWQASATSTPTRPSLRLASRHGSWQSDSMRMPAIASPSLSGGFSPTPALVAAQPCATLPRQTAPPDLTRTIIRSTAAAACPAPPAVRRFARPSLPSEQRLGAASAKALQEELVPPCCPSPSRGSDAEVMHKLLTTASRCRFGPISRRVLPDQLGGLSSLI